MTKEDLMKKFALLLYAQTKTEALLAENAKEQRETEAQLLKTD